MAKPQDLVACSKDARADKGYHGETGMAPRPGDVRLAAKKLLIFYNV